MNKEKKPELEVVLYGNGEYCGNQYQAYTKESVEAVFNWQKEQWEKREKEIRNEERLRIMKEWSKFKAKYIVPLDSDMIKKVYDLNLNAIVELERKIIGGK